MALARLSSAEEWVSRLGEGRKPAVVTIGNFDGIHRGHQKILGKVVEEARGKGQLAAVLTLFPHPLQILRPAEAPALLMTIEQRLAAFETAGIDAALVLPFDLELSKVRPEEFARRYLVETMRASKVLVGENFRFGHRQEGNVESLEAYGRQWGFEVESVKSLTVDGTVASSTRGSRGAARGSRGGCAAPAGTAFCAVRRGTKRARARGGNWWCPTLNLKTEQEMLPKRGVYATGNRCWRQMLSVRHEYWRAADVHGSGTTVETYLLISTRI